MITITPPAKTEMLNLLCRNHGKKFRISVSGLMCGANPILEIVLDKEKEGDEIISVDDMGILLSPDDAALTDYAVIDCDNSAIEPTLIIRKSI